tara:strand:+ start:31 stop:585 length:555 start_codon:yes stop_codon:yes gene_type:complete
MTIVNKAVVGLVLFVGVVNAGALIGNSMKPSTIPVQISYPPTGDYTSYKLEVNPDGSYSIDYKRDDPRVLDSETYVDTSNGVFGVGGRSTTTRNRQYVPGTQSEVQVGVDELGKNNARSEECIKAEGGGQSNGALVGASVASGLAPVVSGIPYVGWLASGWLLIFGQNVGSDIGGEIATTIKGC